MSSFHLLDTAPAFANAPFQVRGTIAAIDYGSITVKAWDGRTLTLKTGPYTTYVDVVPSCLDGIKVIDFVGAADKEPSRAMVAVKLATIPDSMTNDLVSNVSPAAPKLTNMTNGIVPTEKSDTTGCTLAFTYDGNNNSFRITVSPNVPILRHMVAERSAVAIGSTVLIKISAGDQAVFVTVFKAVTPPM